MTLVCNHFRFLWEHRIYVFGVVAKWRATTTTAAMTVTAMTAAAMTVTATTIRQLLLLLVPTKPPTSISFASGAIMVYVVLVQPELQLVAASC